MRIARTRLNIAAATAATAGLAVAALATAPVAGVAGAAPAAVPQTKAIPAITGHTLARDVPTPLTSAECEAKWQIACYNPLQ